MKNNPISEAYNMDCMEYMQGLPDGYFNLVIADPPYGIGIDRTIQRKEGKNGFKKHKHTNWDEKIPTKEYFRELFRVSKNQIICGGNYMVEYLPPTMGWVFWYKMQDNFSFGDGEFIFTSFQTKAKIFKYGRGKSGFASKGCGMSKIHPTQKPVALYKWLLKNYAKEGDKILDTHLGSGSSRIAAFDMGFDFYATELDKDYFDASVKRFNEHTSQLQIF